MASSTTQPAVDLAAALRRHWGYETFRPLQQQIIQSILAGNDIAAVMPTGGGKSLCYQLPAVIRQSTSVVVSPLIALIEDQVAHLSQLGIPATALHSGIGSTTLRHRMRQAALGDYRLVYLSPERIARHDTLEWLRHIPVSLFAIDEAHCISEWGHEFRPEYRQLGNLREHFPRVPIAAFTASATHAVRHDILQQLRLRTPQAFIRSFYRRNLRYFVQMCDAQTQRTQLLDALLCYRSRSVIVYAPTIAAVQSTVELIQANGIRATAYHGQMNADERRASQEAWMHGDSPVIVGTIAFGLGIDKPDVRAVIHLSLPKSVEQYYQETGRAGRDGELADCLLLWRKRDTVLQRVFLERVENPEEQNRCRQRFHQIHAFAAESLCRHLQFCRHFGETPKWKACGHCDVCGWLPPHLQPHPPPAPAIADPPPLLDKMKSWRLHAARSLGISPFLVLSDAALADLVSRCPTTTIELLKVFGIGEYKAKVYGDAILDVIHSRGPVAILTLPPRLERRALLSVAERILPDLKQGLSFEEIASRHRRAPSTILSYVTTLLEAHRIELSPQWVPPERRAAIQEAAHRAGMDRLRPIRDLLGKRYSYLEIGLVVASLRGLEK